MPAKSDGADACLFIIFGVTGNLARKKLLPAFYQLLLNKRMSNFAVIGVARRDFTAEGLLEGSRAHVANFRASAWKELAGRFHYFRTNFSEEDRFEELNAFIASVEKRHALTGNRLFYLATMPEQFELLSGLLARHKIAEQGRSSRQWRRVVFEKPFGHDLASARKINRCIRQVFQEDQIYRIDHYLGKELVQNISLLRFTNTILEPLWNNDYVEHVQIILNEQIGIEGRGNYYDRHGAVKDVVQNHMLQLLSLTAMEAPFKLGGEFIRDSKLSVLKSVRVADAAFGQYRGYRNEQNVRKTSRTETFAAVKLFIDRPRWKGVPFYLVTGKRMKDRLTAIYIQFRRPPCLLLSGVCDFDANHLLISIQPDAGFHLHVNTKAPGTQDIKGVNMDFCHPCVFGLNTPEAYENLLLDAVHGDCSVFVRSDEIEQQWKIVEDILALKPRVQTYEAGVHPASATRLIEKDGYRWYMGED